MRYNRIGRWFEQPSRLGIKRIDCIRPLCVTFQNKYDAVSVLRNVKKYNGPVRVRQDMTIKQRNYLKKLRSDLQLAIDSDDNNKTIRYINGIPKIIETNNATKH